MFCLAKPVQPIPCSLERGKNKKKNKNEQSEIEDLFLVLFFKAYEL